MSEIEKKANDMMANLCQCHEMCISSIAHSLEEGGDFVIKSHMTIMMDCAEICHVASDFYLRDSDFAGDMLDLCAIICDECAESCATFFEDEMMVECSEACTNCAKSCRDMVIYDEDIEIEETDEKEQK